MNKLKIGQTIDVYNVIKNDFGMSLCKAGNTYIGEVRRGYDAVYVFTNAHYDSDGMTVMFPHEVKRIGCFVVKQLK